ncbi:hypothetical protein [Peterkaempfera sp. SMS 1(5)a]|uniref:hypothetical protein n=1 Tax=Peterkaempfera podocarpi TaxID=3232308 RepID=UPI003672244B
MLEIWRKGGWATRDFSGNDVRVSPVKLPAQLDLSYTAADGSGTGDLLDLAAASQARLKPGQYWTWKGIMTEQQIDAQEGCAPASPVISMK